MKKVDEKFKDDYSRILPVFKYGNKDVASQISSDMDLAIKKASKMIMLHSIKAKPAVKKGHRMTAEEKEFYNKNEFNKWVDVGYLLIGKSHLYKQDYPNAAETFKFIIREFPKELSRYEAQIWLARTYSQTKEYKDAENILTTLEGDKKFPKKYKLDLYTTRADFYLKQEQFEPAIKYLEKSLELVRSKKLKVRYMFILAQLYQQMNYMEKASMMYTRVIRKNPPYEMTFNARINLASSFTAGSKSDRDIKKHLHKMLRDNKNVDFKDQIYYALGNIEMKEGNKKEGIDYYKESVHTSTKNNDQKALSCLTLANLYYSDKNYVPAQAYYDSTLLYIAQDYPDLADIKAKAANLTRLVKNLNAISTEDSLQRIAKLPEAERMKIIDGIINNLRTKEAEAQMAETQRLQDYYNSQYRQSMVAGDKNSAAKWYFYNPVSVAQGMRDFQLKWGRRRNEDDWQRKDKSANFGNEGMEVAVENKQDKDKKKAPDNKSREFYIQNLPLTDSLMKVSRQRVIDGYYYGGMVYHEDLNDIPQAIALYEKMLERFPETSYTAPVYYQLFKMYSELKNESKAAYYRNLVLSRFPDTNYAKVLNDPDFYKQVMQAEKQVDQLFEQTYKAYQNKDYQQVIANVQVAFNQFKKDPSIPKFAMLRALAIGKTSDALTFRTELNKIVEQYPKDDVSTRAKDIIAFLNTYKPETKQQEDLKVAEVTYALEEHTIYYVALVIEKQEDVNQIVFDIINFNLDNFSNDKLEINNEDLGSNYKILSIRTFPDKDKAMAYFKAISAKPEVFKDVKSNTRQLFIISPANYQILRKQKTADSYAQFFKVYFQ
jgi:tetratricopeptide (TPR) repeat protein